MTSKLQLDAWKLPRVQPGLQPRGSMAIKKTHRHCVRLNDVSFEGLMIHSTTTANGHGCLFFVAFRFQFGGV